MATKKMTRKKMIQRNDGWSNILTNLGVSNKDKRTGASVTATFLRQSEVENFYSGDDVAARIVDRLPEEMTREGFEVYCDDFPDINEEIQEIFEKYDLYKKLEYGLKFSRLYGGAGLIIGAVDGVQASLPLDIDNIPSIDYWTLLHSYQLIPFDSEIDGDVLSPNYGLPKYYKIQDQSGSSDTTKYNTVKIHNSRVIRFEGVYVPPRLKSIVNYWGDSILTKLYTPISNYQSCNDSCALVMQDMTQLIIKLKNLADMIASGDDALVTRRLSLLTSTASIINAVVVEEGEEVERKTTSLTGIPELLAKVNARLVAATDYPHTILLGESPSGLGATGQSEKMDWYAHVKNQQESILRPIIKKILNLMFASKSGPTKGVIPEKYSIEFCSLWQPSDKDVADTRKVVAETDQIYSNIGVLDPDEIAQNRFGNMKFSMETKIDMENRAKLSTPEQEDDIEN